jgi:GH35 family endo-1,4-beta-xylanase
MVFILVVLVLALTLAGLGLTGGTAGWSDLPSDVVTRLREGRPSAGTPIVRRAAAPTSSASLSTSTSAAPGPAPTQPPPSPRADLVGVAGNAFPWESQWSDFGRLLQESQLGWARVELRWEQIQPRRGAWNYGDYDRLVNGYAARNVEQLGLLAYSVAWATGGAGNAPVFGPPTDLDAWETFVRTTVSRYRDQIHAWEIWNEPDVALFWNGQDGGDPAGYLALLRRAYRAVKAADPNATVVTGGVTGTERGTRFVSSLLDLGGGDYVDALGFHGYLPNDGLDNDDYRSLVWPLIRQVRERAGKPLWITEYGWSVEPGDNAAAGSEAKQAQNLARELPLLFTLGQVEHVLIFQLKDPNNHTNSFGIVRADATPRPAYMAIKTVAGRLIGLEFDQAADLGVAGVTDIRFGSADRTVDILWSTAGDQAVEIPTDQPTIRVWHLDGTQETHESADGAVSLTAGADPIIVERGQGTALAGSPTGSNRALASRLPVT